MRSPWTDFPRREHLRVGGALVWLAFILFPLGAAVAKHAPVLHRVLTIAGAAVFVGAYIALVFLWRERRSVREGPSRLEVALFVVLLAVAAALTVAEAASWGFLFTYCAACAAMIAPPSLGFLPVGTCVLLAGALSAAGGASGSTVLSFVATSAGIGLLMLLMRDLRARNDELCEARAELARLAVAEERARFARDLHDLLGHSLSVIALKAELAGRLLPDRAPEAAAHVAELESVARGALTEVRDAVSGYRQPTLEGELAGARMALSAAGIEASVDAVAARIDPAVEAVLAWAVREGATNVIRHSGARRCSVRVTAGLAAAGVEVVDDGHGEAPRVNGRGGHGLEGLGERVARLQGRIEAEARPEGGFRLSVSVPLPVR
jgi:two-component system sensor histidine kinase DesK